MLVTHLGDDASRLQLFLRHNRHGVFDCLSSVSIERARVQLSLAEKRAVFSLLGSLSLDLVVCARIWVMSSRARNKLCATYGFAAYRDDEGASGKTTRADGMRNVRLMGNFFPCP